MEDNMFYKLALDRTVDKDVCDWLDSLPRSRKAEVVRHALRYYINTLDDGEVIKMTVQESTVSNAISESKVKVPIEEVVEVKKSDKKTRPKINFLQDSSIGGIVDTD